MESARAKSRLDFDSANTWECINAGSLQRIADACEKMAANWNQLTRERDQYKRWWEEERASNRRMGRSINSLRGVITKQKRQKVSA